MPDKLIVHCTHHKTGTTWFRLLLKDLAQEFGLRYFQGPQAELPPDAQIFVQIHSNIDRDALPVFVGTHMIRDPRDVAVSAFRYHLHAEEPWLLEPREDLGGRSYSETIKSLEQPEALLLEIKHNPTLRNLLLWDYTDPRFLELKYEEVITDPETWFPKIFSHYGFSGAELPRAMEVAQRNSFEAKTGRKLGEVAEGQHLRSGVPRQWEKEFDQRHRDLFRELHGKSLIQLGYEADNSW